MQKGGKGTAGIVFAVSAGERICLLSEVPHTALSVLVLREKCAIFQEKQNIFLQGQSGLLVSVPQKLHHLPSGQLQCNFGRFSTLARILAENMK